MQIIDKFVAVQGFLEPFHLVHGWQAAILKMNEKVARNEKVS